MAYIDEAGRRTQKLVAAIQKDPNIPASTRETVEGFIAYMEARGLSPRTVLKNLYCLSVFLKAVGNKDVKALSKDGVMAAIGQVERSDYSEKTKSNIKISVKVFFKHFAGNDEIYPEQVRWIKTTLKSSKRIMPEDILTEDDVLKLLDAAKNDRDKAIIALLFDAGIRVGELLTLRIKDIDLDGDPAHIRVNGKTGMRQIPIMFSPAYLAKYVDLRKKDRKPNDYLWERFGKWASADLGLDRQGVVKILKTAAKRAGIEKKTNPHAFRHARATYYANRLTEQQLKQFFGWTGGSQMPQTYVHLSGRDIDNSVMQANGRKVLELQQPKLQNRVCPSCRDSKNGAEKNHCGNCGAALDISVAMAQDARNEIYDEITKDPDVLKAIAKFNLKKRAKLAETAQAFQRS